MLERTQHTYSAFLTLTYRDEDLPISKQSGLPTLSPRDLQLWLKKLRKALSPVKVRFFAVGEYGTETQRPHYHVMLFGMKGCSRGQTSPRHIREIGFCCPSCTLLQNTWEKGSIFQGEVTSESAQYVAGYTVKKMTSVNDARLRGRHPEFTRMSLRPGIGAGAVPEIASQLMALDLDTTEADVPVGLRHGSKILPFGQYLRRKLRAHMGKDEKTPEAVIHQMEEEVYQLQQITFETSESLEKALGQVLRGQELQVETRAELFKKRDKL